MSGEVAYWKNYALKLEGELAALRTAGLPKLSTRDMFTMAALAGLVAGRTFQEPGEAAALAEDFADACMARRAEETP